MKIIPGDLFSMKPGEPFRCLFSENGKYYFALDHALGGTPIKSGYILTFLGYDDNGQSMVLYEDKVLHTLYLQQYLERGKIEVVKCLQ